MAVLGMFKSFGGDYKMKVIVSLVGHLHPLDLAAGEVLFFFCART